MGLSLRLGTGNESRRRINQIEKRRDDYGEAPPCAKSARLPPCKDENRKPRQDRSRTTGPRTSGSQGAPGSDSRDIEPHLGLADRYPAGVRQDRQERGAALPECAERRLSPGGRLCPSGRV